MQYSRLLIGGVQRKFNTNFCYQHAKKKKKKKEVTNFYNIIENCCELLLKLYLKWIRRLLGRSRLFTKITFLRKKKKKR